MEIDSQRLGVAIVDAAASSPDDDVSSTMVAMDEAENRTAKERQRERRPGNKVMQLEAIATIAET